MGIKSINKKGFTLIEVLVAVVILGILTTVGIVAVTNVIKSSHEKFDKSQYETFLETAEIYFTDNKARLPLTPMAQEEITLQELIDLKYIDKLLDSNKNEFDYSKSKVVVTRLETGKYKYEGILVRKTGDSIGSILDQVNNDNSQILFELKNKNEYYNEGIIYYTNKQPQVSITMSDSEGLAGYRYIIYKNGKQFKSSENIKLNGESSYTDIITFGEEYTYGKYSLKVTVYDQKGNKTTKTNASNFIVYIDRVKPTCSIKIDGKTGDNGWYKEKNITLTLKEEDKESGILKHALETNNNFSNLSNLKTITEITKTQTDTTGTTWYGYVQDKAGNVCSKNVEVKVDTQKPACDIKGASTEVDAARGTNLKTVYSNIWYNIKTSPDIKFLRLVYSDKTSGISKYILAKNDTTLAVNYRNISNIHALKTVDGEDTYYGYVRDKAGNETECNKPIKKDTIAPSCPSSSTAQIPNPPNKYIQSYSCWKSYSYTCSKPCTDAEGNASTCSGTCYSSYLSTCYRTIYKYVSPDIVFSWYNFANDITRGYMYAKESSSTQWQYKGSYSPPSSSVSFTIAGEEEFYGTYSGKIEVYDQADNMTDCGGETPPASEPEQSTPATCPTITSTNAQANTWTNKDVTINISGFSSNVESFDWYTDTGDGNWNLISNNNSATDNTETLDGEGTRRGKVVVYNSQGEATECVTPTYYIDKTAPTNIEVKMYKETETTATSTDNAYTSGWYKNYVYTTASAQDTLSGIDKYYYTTTGATTNATDAEGSTRHINAGGTSTIKYKACDKAGNCTDYTAEKTVKLDHTAPKCKITITNDPTKNHGWYTSNVKLEATCSDEGGSGCTDATKTITKTIKEDTIEDVEFEVKDNVGRTGTCVKEILLDKTPPKIEWSKEKNAICDGHTYPYVVHPGVSDYYSQYVYGEFSWGCGDSSGSTTCTNTTERKADFYDECIGSATSFSNQSVTYKVCDKAGNCAKGTKSNF